MLSSSASIYGLSGQLLAMSHDTSQSASRRFYKPTATRTPFLVVLLIATLILFAFTELAIRRIPAHAGYGKVGNTLNSAIKKGHLKREVLGRQKDSAQPSVEVAAPSIQATPIATSLQNAPIASPNASLAVTPTASQKGSAAVGIPTAPLSGNPVSANTANDGWGSLSAATKQPTGPSLSVGKGGQPTTPSPAKETSSTPIAVPIVPVPIPTPNPYVPATPGKPVPTGTLVPTNAGPYLLPGATHLTPGDNAKPSEIVVVTNTGPYLTLVAGQTVPNPQNLPVIEPLTPGVQSAPANISPGPGVIVLGSQTHSATPVLTVVDGRTLVVTPAASLLNTVAYTQTPVLIVVDGKTYTQAPAPITANPTQTSPNGYLENNPSGTSNGPPVETIVNSTGILLREYIIVAFVPLIVAVLYTLPWRILDSTIREMEPFYQLNRRGGALGKNSLCLDYSTSYLITTPFKAISRGHYIPFWSSLINIAVLILAPISSEAFAVAVYGECGTNSVGPCHAFWGIYPAHARGIQGILGFIAILIICLVAFSYPRSSEVYSEPLSIGGLSVLLAKSPLLKNLRQIDSMIPSKELQQLMAGGRFGLSSFIADDRTRCHGIIPLELEPEAGLRLAGNLGRKDPTRQFKALTNITSTSMVLLRLQIVKAFYFGSFLVVGGLLTLITYYHWTGPDPVTGKTTGFETFMDSQGMGVRFMMTAGGVGVKLLWTNVDCDYRRTAPFSSLIRGSSHSKYSILVPFHASHTSAILPSLQRMHFLGAYIAFLAFLSEFLPICLANIAFSPAMTKDAYTICHFLSMSILILMVIATTILLLVKPGGAGSLPRRPGYGGMVNTAVYLAALSEADGTFSNVFGRESERERGLLDNVAGLSMLSSKERDDAILGIGNLYSMGVVDGGNDDRLSYLGRRRSAGEVSEELRIDDDRRVRRLLKE
ncbi:hypothetical protein BJ875DRAFT_486826 [Amylocarpus encephaloides]|uniref:Uncharacterized protein n=1 Tax=Amylocarpus encephaloides TaxID=45428 RepID=A0A9P7YD24_9HELO|nr:hypothetical protein BJ875DRAFT_486826 [Amylocarpus encephaloides]